MATKGKSEERNSTTIHCLQVMFVFLPIDRSLTGTTNPDRSEPVSNGNGRVMKVPHSPTRLEPFNQLKLIVITRTHFGEKGFQTTAEELVMYFTSPTETANSFSLVFCDRVWYQKVSCFPRSLFLSFIFSGSVFIFIHQKVKKPLNTWFIHQWYCVTCVCFRVCGK